MSVHYAKECDENKALYDELEKTKYNMLEQLKGADLHLKEKEGKLDYQEKKVKDLNFDIAAYKDLC